MRKAVSSRSRLLALSALTATIVGASGPALACEGPLESLRPSGSTPTPADRFGCNLVDAGSGENLVFYGAALLSTMELSASGLDHELRVAIEERLGTRGFSDVTVTLGFVGPPAVGALLYGSGLLSGHRRLSGAGAAALQAMTVTFVTTVLLKGLTGRPFPNHGGDPTSPDRLLHPEWAREWRGPLLENSAWPSGHTSVAIALASALTSYYVDVPWIAMLAYPAASFIAFGMLSGAHHWASDVVAGGLIGHAIGSTIGRDFRRMQDANVVHGPSVSLVPFGGAGLAIAGAF